MRTIATIVIAVLVAALTTSTCPASTTIGGIGDGKTTVWIEPTTGAVTIYPEGNPVGLIQILSASGIFTAEARFPSRGLFFVDSPSEKAWAVLRQDAFSFNHRLGNIVPPGISLSFLLNDLTITGSGGFGTDNRDLDLFYTSHGGGGSLHASDAQLAPRVAGAQVAHQFSASPANASVNWSNLYPGTNNPTPASVPTLTSTGLFSWNTAGSPSGTYVWNALATSGDFGAVGRLTVTVVPEPSGLVMASTTFLGIAALFCFRHKPEFGEHKERKINTS